MTTTRTADWTRTIPTDDLYVMAASSMDPLTRQEANDAIQRRWENEGLAL